MNHVTAGPSNHPTRWFVTHRPPRFCRRVSIVGLTSTLNPP